MELSENVKHKLSLAVEEWADEHLAGKPALLATGVFFSMERELLRKQAEIEKLFNEGSK